MTTDTAPQNARTWLQTEQAPPQRVAEVARALALLSDQVAPTPAAFKQPLGADVELALLEEADARGRIDLVQLLASHAAHKATTKHAKKLLFRAKQRGVAVPEARPTRAPVDLSTRPEPLPSYASTFDGLGGQLLFLGGWSQTDGPYCVLAMVTDAAGLVSAWYMPDSSRTRQREMLQRLSGQLTGFTVEVPDAFVAGRMRWGLELRDRLGQPFEGDQAEVRRLLADVEPIQSLDIAMDPEDEARLDEHMAAAGGMIDDPCFATWLQPDPKATTELNAAIGPLRDQPPEDVAALRATVEAARDAAVARWLDADARQKLADRLEITSWLLANHGQRDHALRSVATARGLRDAQRPVANIGFVAAAVDRWAPLDHLVRYVQQRETDLVVQAPRPARR